MIVFGTGGALYSWKRGNPLPKSTDWEFGAQARARDNAVLDAQNLALSLVVRNLQEGTAAQAQEFWGAGPGSPEYWRGFKN